RRGHVPQRFPPHRTCPCIRPIRRSGAAGVGSPKPRDAARRRVAWAGAVGGCRSLSPPAKGPAPVSRAARARGSFSPSFGLTVREAGPARLVLGPRGPDPSHLKFIV